MITNEHQIAASAVVLPRDQSSLTSRNLRKEDLLDIESGNYAEIYFGNGTVMKAYGPSRLRIADSRRAYLERGVTIVRVAKGDEGFTVGTPGGEFLDLGTEFGVSVNGLSASEMHVFDGKVAVKAEGQASSVLLKGEAVGITSSGQLEPAEPMDSWDFVAYNVPISQPKDLQSVEYVKSLPQSIRPKEWAVDGKVRLFCERRAFRLPEPLEVTAWDQGTITSDVSGIKTTTLPAGTVCDVYFLHCDSTAGVTGRIGFDHPILGMSLTGAQIVAGDRFCHRPEVVGYQPSESALNWKRGSVVVETQDVLTMNRDTNSFDFTLFCGPTLDQMRIFVAVPPPNL